MKIAMPVNENSIDSTVCVSFGRCPYFLIYNTDTEENIFLENKSAESPSGAGIKAAQFIVDEKVDILLTPRVGEKANKVFENTKIKFYKTKGDNIVENIKDFNKGKLEILDVFNKGSHGGK